MALFKKNKENRKKGAETTIGKIIYGFLLFMPLLAIGITAITTFWNNTIEMPTQEVNEIPPYQTNEVNSINDLIVGNIYDFTVVQNYTTTQVSYFKASKVFNVTNSTTTIDLDASTTNDTWLDFKESNRYFQFNTSTGKIFYLTDYDAPQQLAGITFQFVYYGDFNANYITQVSSATQIPPGTYEIIEHETTDLNVFYYAVEQVENSNLFNWATTTGTYTVLHNTTTALGITNTFIPMLMAYWLIVSVIYFLFDIALILIWAVHKKIHELSEAI